MIRRIDRMTWKIDGRYHVWHTERLWKAAEGLPVSEIEIDSLKHVDSVCWFDDHFPPTLRNVVEHFTRMEQVDMSYPIILDPSGQLLDGAHRVAKAMANGQATIRAVRLPELPPPDEIVDSIE